MIKSLTYILLLSIMAIVLYCSGKGLKKNNGVILSKAGFWAIICYTLNEGLRFGRGIDYNAYWISYDDLTMGYVERKMNVGFWIIEKFFSCLNLPWYCCVIFISFMFILGTLFFLKRYKEIFPYALPFFCLFSMGEVENMLRWYLSFSIFLIGMSSLIENTSLKKYIIFSLLACSCHYAFFPIPLLFYFLYKINRPLVSPLVAIVFFFIIGLTFRTSIMLNFSSLLGKLISTSDYFGMYGGDRLDYWLTGGYAGMKTKVFPHFSEIIMSCILIYFGHKALRFQEKKYVLLYNLFIIGFMLLPIANQIELLRRYVYLLYFFRALVLAGLIKCIFIDKTFKCDSLFRLIFVFIIVLYVGKPFVKPIYDNPKKYLYVWNKDRETPYTMINVWLGDANSRLK